MLPSAVSILLIGTLRSKYLFNLLVFMLCTRILGLLGFFPHVTLLAWFTIIIFNGCHKLIVSILYSAIDGGYS